MLKRLKRQASQEQKKRVLQSRETLERQTSFVEMGPEGIFQDSGQQGKRGKKKKLTWAKGKKLFSTHSFLKEDPMESLPDKKTEPRTSKEIKPAFLNPEVSLELLETPQLL